MGSTHIAFSISGDGNSILVVVQDKTLHSSLTLPLSLSLSFSYPVSNLSGNTDISAFKIHSGPWTWIRGADAYQAQAVPGALGTAGSTDDLALTPRTPGHPVCLRPSCVPQATALPLERIRVPIATHHPGGSRDLDVCVSEGPLLHLPLACGILVPRPKVGPELLWWEL